MAKILFSMFLILNAAQVSAGELDSKFDAIAAQFARDAATRSIDLAVSPAVVFPYSCDEKLAKKRVDLAVGEILTARLMKAGTFRLVERTQLDVLLREQKLGLSGAIDSATAAQVGKLAGAKLAILGTVARVGSSYQLSSKLVDTQSAEIISASIVEMPLETFDTEAARYLVLVPEREALGLYLGFMTWPVKTKSLPATTLASGQTVTPQSASGSFVGIAVGLRYQFARHWLADLAVFPAANLGTLAKFSVSGATYQPYPGTLDGEGARLSFSRIKSVSNRWRALYGLGYQIYGFSFYDSGTQSIYAGNTRILDKPKGGDAVYGAFATGGMEFKIKERFAWSLQGQLNQPGKIECIWTTPAGASVKVMELDMPVFMLSSALTLYF